MRIDDLTAHPALVESTAAILVLAFKDNWPNAWPSLSAAVEEVRALLAGDAIARVALDSGGAPMGLVGGLPMYGGHVFELHPLAVHPDRQGRGVGRALVADLEEQVRLRGASTVLLGTDDEAAMTSLGGVDLYPDPLEHLRTLRNLRRHPFEFYRKLGYSVVGVIPDANGFGKPDLWMAKRVRSAREG